MKLKGIDLSNAYKLGTDCKIFLIIGGGNEVRIKISPRRFITTGLSNEKVRCLIYNQTNGRMGLEELDKVGTSFDLPALLDKYEIEYEPSNADDWKRFRIFSSSDPITLGERGFYWSQHFWLDCNVYRESAYFNETAEILPGVHIRRIAHETAFKKIDAGFYAFLDKIINEPFDINELEQSIRSYAAPAFEDNMWIDTDKVSLRTFYHHISVITSEANYKFDAEHVGDCVSFFIEVLEAIADDSLETLLSSI